MLKYQYKIKNMNTIKKQRNFKVLFIISGILVGIFALIYLVNLFNDKSKSITTYEYITDFNNLEKVSGISDNIFVVKITKNSGSLLNWHSRDFEGEVLLNIKGKAPKKIKLSESAEGYVMVNRAKMDLSLKKGKIYLLSVAHVKDNLYSVLEHENTVIELTKEDLKDLNKNKKVLEFKKAYINEIPLKNAYSENTFKKLPEKEQKKLKKEVLD